MASRIVSKLSQSGPGFRNPGVSDPVAQNALGSPGRPALAAWMAGFARTIGCRVFSESGTSDPCGNRT